MLFLEPAGSKRKHIISYNIVCYVELPLLKRINSNNQQQSARKLKVHSPLFVVTKVLLCHPNKLSNLFTVTIYCYYLPAAVMNVNILGYISNQYIGLQGQEWLLLGGRGMQYPMKHGAVRSRVATAWYGGRGGLRATYQSIL